jgi:hypothetical protein
MVALQVLLAWLYLSGKSTVTSLMPNLDLATSNRHRAGWLDAKLMMTRSPLIGLCVAYTVQYEA